MGELKNDDVQESPDIDSLSLDLDNVNLLFLFVGCNGDIGHIFFDVDPG